MGTHGGTSYDAYYKNSYSYDSSLEHIMKWDYAYKSWKFKNNTESESHYGTHSAGETHIEGDDKEDK